MSVALSVIVPAYNAEQYLESCVASIMASSYWDFEMLMIDDGSTDGTGVLCNQLQQLYGNVKVFHTRNRRLPCARNLGIDQAAGRYIGFVDADDLVSADMFERLVGAMGADTQLSTCRFRRCGRAEAISYVTVHRSVLLLYAWGWKYSLSAVLLGLNYSLWAMVFRRKIQR